MKSWNCTRSPGLILKGTFLFILIIFAFGFNAILLFRKFLLLNNKKVRRVNEYFAGWKIGDGIKKSEINKQDQKSNTRRDIHEGVANFIAK